MRHLFRAVRADGPTGIEQTEALDLELDEIWLGELERQGADYITWVQKGLNHVAGARLTVDGRMLGPTRNAVRAFQQARGLLADGVIGPQTESALVAAGAGTPPPADEAISPNTIDRTSTTTAARGSTMDRFPEYHTSRFDSGSTLDELFEETDSNGEMYFLEEQEGATPKSIEDRTAYSPKERRKGVRDMKKVYALVLHQMAFSRGNDPKKYDSVGSHFTILPDGKITQLHPESALLWASNGFNPGSVAVEFAGNFPNTKGTCWEAKKYGCHKVTPQQIEAGRFLVEYLIKKIGLTHILAHRQSSGDRENDPGPDIWYGVGQWAIEKHGLKDGGPGFKVSDGNPIPDSWRNWGRGTGGGSSKATKMEEDDDSGWFDFPWETKPQKKPATSVFPDSVIKALRNGMESVSVRLAVARGNRDENSLTNLIFHGRYPARGGRSISTSETGYQALRDEWIEIRDTLVRPILQQQGTAAPVAPSGKRAEETTCAPVGCSDNRPVETKIRALLPFLKRYQGTIPIDFLLGWIAVESGGCIGVVTSICERGFFQVYPGEATEVGADPHLLSTDPEYSVRMGIEMVKQRGKRAAGVGLAYGTDMYWHFTKLYHWLPAGVSIIVRMMKAEGVWPARTWADFTRFVHDNRAQIIATLSKEQKRPNLARDIDAKGPGKHGWDPLTGLNNVDKVFARGAALGKLYRQNGDL